MKQTGHSSVVANTFVRQNMGLARTTIRAQQPDHSLEESELEDEIITSNGIIRRTQVSAQCSLYMTYLPLHQPEVFPIRNWAQI